MLNAESMLKAEMLNAEVYHCSWSSWLPQPSANYAPAYDSSLLIPPIRRNIAAPLTALRVTH